MNSKKQESTGISLLTDVFNEVASLEPAEEHKKKKEEKDYDHFNFICDKNQKQEILAISRTTGISIKEIMGRALRDFIKRYKKKNGEIIIDVNPHKSIDDLL